MPKQQTMRARLSPEAEADLSELMEWTDEHFGQGAALRYAELVIQGLRDLETDPGRAGTRQRDELSPGVYSYHLAASRDHVAGARVKKPRHFIIYQMQDEAVLEVLRILHDSRDLARHLPEA